MTNEAVPIELYGELEAGQQRRYVCADTPKISKGTLLALSDPRTAATSTGNADVCAGIASMDKEADDGTLSISAWTNGVFDMIASGTIVIGAPLKTAGAGNYVAAAGDASGAAVIGYALEAGTDEEVINCRISL